MLEKAMLVIGVHAGAITTVGFAGGDGGSTTLHAACALGGIAMLAVLVALVVRWRKTLARLVSKLPPPPPHPVLGPFPPIGDAGPTAGRGSRSAPRLNGHDRKLDAGRTN
jgi:hypothetical protein